MAFSQVASFRSVFHLKHVDRAEDPMVGVRVRGLEDEGPNTILNRFHSSESKEPESSSEYAAANTPSGLRESLCTRVVTKRMNMARRFHRKHDSSRATLDTVFVNVWRAGPYPMATAGAVIRERIDALSPNRGMPMRLVWTSTRRKRRA